MDDHVSADFMEALDPGNTAAEAGPGFVWRLEDENGNAPSFGIPDDDRWLVNMSVGESLESLRGFIASRGHLRRLGPCAAEPGEA